MSDGSSGGRRGPGGARRGTRWAVALCALAVLAAVAWWTVPLWRAGSAATADASDPVLVARGQEVYQQQCAACHGANLEGQPDWRVRRPNGRLPAPPHDASGHTWHHPDTVLFEIVMDGIAKHAPPGYQSDMPAYRGVLSERDVWAVLAYIKSRWSSEIRQRRQQIHDAARNS